MRLSDAREQTDNEVIASVNESLSEFAGTSDEYREPRAALQKVCETVHLHTRASDSAEFVLIPPLLDLTKVWNDPNVRAESRLAKEAGPPSRVATRWNTVCACVRHARLSYRGLRQVQFNRRDSVRLRFVLGVVDGRWVICTAFWML